MSNIANIFVENLLIKFQEQCEAEQTSIQEYTPLIDSGFTVNFLGEGVAPGCLCIYNLGGPRITITGVDAELIPCDNTHSTLDFIMNYISGADVEEHHLEWVRKRLTDAHKARYTLPDSSGSNESRVGDNPMTTYQTHGDDITMSDQQLSGMVDDVLGEIASHEIEQLANINLYDDTVTPVDDKPFSYHVFKHMVDVCTEYCIRVDGDMSSSYSNYNDSLELTVRFNLKDTTLVMCLNRIAYTSGQDNSTFSFIDTGSNQVDVSSVYTACNTVSSHKHITILNGLMDNIESSSLHDKLKTLLVTSLISFSHLSDGI